MKAAFDRAFLDSGLTDSERETVAMVVKEMMGRAELESGFWPAIVKKWAAALAPIVEVKP